MSYASGQTVSAADYNGLTGSGSVTSGTINYVWDVGNGQWGYGQGGVATVATGATVTATQWSTMLNALNRAKQHQSGAGATLGPLNYSAGQTITYFANVVTAISTINSNHNVYTANGSTLTGAGKSYTPTAGQGATYSGYIGTRTVTFASGDAARYFFNCGGYLNFVSVSTTNGDGTTRSQDALNMFNGIGTYTFGQAQYNAITTSYVNVKSATDSGTYTGNYVHLDVLSSAQNASGHGDKGAVVQFGIYLYDAHGGAWNNSLNVTYNHRVDVIYPETTYLSSSPWGTPTVA